MKNFIFEYRIPWVETDALGIVHFSNYFRLCERTEQEFFNYLNLNDREIYLPRVHAKCDYKHSLKFNQTARVKLSIQEIGKRHITLDYEIWNVDDDIISAHCTIIVVPVDKEMKPVNMDEYLLDKLKEYLVQKK